MKSPITRLLILLCLCLFLKANLYAQKINTEALEAYWKITDQLRKGDTLSVQAWNNFLQLDGNRQYVANQNFSPQFLEDYRKTMQLVYMPQYADQLKKMVADTFKYWVAYKINQYQANEAALRDYASHLKDKAYLNSMYANAWKWLPKQLHAKSPETMIYFIGIDNDALVDHGTIVFTTWSAYNQDKLKNGILGGHELHHILRKPMVLKR